MALMNPIINTEATMADGSVIAYRDTDPLHHRQERFRKLYDASPLSFTITVQDGSVFTVDLVTGSLTVCGNAYYPDPAPTTPLRLIYYKRMRGDTGGAAYMEFFALGWQTTTEDGNNLRMGLRIYPQRWEISGAI